MASFVDLTISRVLLILIVVFLNKNYKKDSMGLTNLNRKTKTN